MHELFTYSRLTKTECTFIVMEKSNSICQVTLHVAKEVCICDFYEKRNECFDHDQTKKKHEQEIQCSLGNIRVDVNIVKHEIYRICLMYVLNQ